MSESLERFQAGGGQIERFGMSTAIGDQLDANFVSRGEQMASLVLATLTETPYTPVIGSTRYAVEISNKYDDRSPDTVEEAVEALEEATQAHAPGMQRVNLISSFATRYGEIAYDLHARRKDGERNKKALEEAMVERLRARGIAVPNPTAAYEIIAHAPKKLAGLMLTHTLPGYGTRQNRLLSTEGRLVNFTTENRTGIIRFNVWRDYLSNDVRDRGGQAPRASIVHEIQRRVVTLRTQNSERP